MYLAKPFDSNLMGSKKFETIQECKNFLDEFTEQKMPIDEWIVLGKIQEIDVSGKAMMPKVYPKMRKGKMIMAKVDIGSFL